MQTLNNEQMNMLIKILRKYFLNAYKMIFMLDQKQADNFKSRNLYYYEQKHKCKHGHSHSHETENNSEKGCCGSFFSKVYIPEKERTGLETLVCEAFRPFSLKESMPKILEYLSQRFNSIKKSGEKDKMQWDTEAEVFVLNEVLREGVQVYFSKEIKQLMQHEQFVDSKQQLLVATPQTWLINHPKIPLDFLSASFLQGLMKEGYGLMDPFLKNLDFSRALFKELNFLEKDGKFEEPLQELTIRQDKIFWINLSQIEKESFKSIYFIAHVLSALPYEMNVKTQILAQISESYQISYFYDQRKLHSAHLDSSIDKKNDNGKKVTILYFCLGDEKSENYLIINKSQKIMIKQDMIVGLQSRTQSYEITGDGSKMFVVRYWIDGPFDNKHNF